MNFTQEQINLANTDFGEEIEKVAAAKAEAITNMYNYGFNEYAVKVAAEHDAEEEKKKKKEDGEEDEEMDGESEKAAAELGAFAERGFFEGLAKLGQERHGNPDHYILPLVLEKVAADAKATFLQRLTQGAKNVGAKAKEYGGKAVQSTKDYHTGMVANAKSGYINLKNAKNTMNSSGTAILKTKGAERLEGLKQLGLAGAKGLPHAALLGAAGYGGYKAMGGGQEKQASEFVTPFTLLQD
jgi:hypothetical protein